MVNFKNIKIRTPEERKAEEAAEERREVFQRGKLEELRIFEEGGYLNEFDSKFARSVINQYRMNFGYLSKKQWRYLDVVLLKPRSV